MLNTALPLTAAQIAALPSLALDWAPLPGGPSELAESPLWDAVGQRLYWCDIEGHAVHAWSQADGTLSRWQGPKNPASLALDAAGRLLVAARDGLWVLEPDGGLWTHRQAAPYDPAFERFNDGKVGPDGAFWVGTVWDPRDRPAAGLYRVSGDGIRPVASGVRVSNGLAASLDGQWLHWACTRAHAVRRFPLAAPPKAFAETEPWLTLAERAADGAYAGRPDGMATDAEGHFWLALYEGRQLLRVAPDGRPVARVPLPVSCPTMPAFGGPDGRTLFVATARHGRPEAERAAEPWAGCVLQATAPVAGAAVPRLAFALAHAG